jgi:hypothetical protein
MAAGFREGFVEANGLRVCYRREKGQAIIDMQGGAVEVAAQRGHRMKQPNRVKAAMRAGRKAYGYSLSFPSPWVIGEDRLRLRLH